MSEGRVQLPLVLKDGDFDQIPEGFYDWQIELIHLGHGPIRRSGIVMPIDGAKIALFQMRRATVLRGTASASEFCLIATSPGSPLVRTGARALRSDTCLLLAPQAGIDLYLPKDCCAFILSIPAAAINAAILPSDLAGLPVTGHAELRALTIDQTALLSKCMDLAETFHRSLMPQLVATHVVCRIREWLVAAIVSLFAHSQALGTEPSEKTIRRRAVVRACAYIDVNLRKPMTLHELCDAAGVRSRTLEYGFREFYDIGPMAYLRCVRLCRVRRDLLQARRSSVAVANTAQRWTFSHMGQFSRDYRLLFGETPSRTLARGRVRHEAVSG